MPAQHNTTNPPGQVVPVRDPVASPAQQEKTLDKEIDLYKEKVLDKEQK